MEALSLLSYLRGIGVQLSLKNEKIQVCPRDALTDVIRRQIRDHRGELIVYLQIESSCSDLLVNPLQVINGLLSVDDEQDLINGNIHEIALKLHIKLWIAKGMPHYSGKPELKIYQGEN